MDLQLEDALRVLGIPAGSDRETLLSAYRRRARATHPDVSSDPDAAERFAAVTAAYRLVSGVPCPGPHTSLDSRGDPVPKPSSPLRPATPTRHREPEDVVDHWWTPGWDLRAARLLLGAPHPGDVRSWPRPPIVAGPVVVRSTPLDAGRRPGHG